MSATPLLAREVLVAHGARRVLGPVSLALAAGRVLGLVGPNGAGKSTLLRALAGLVPHAGAVELLGRPLAATPARVRARAIGYLPQDPEIAWPLSTRELVALGRLPHGELRDDDAQVAQALGAFGLAPLAARNVLSLSGGERMRAHLARLAAGAHRVLLIDEPTASLDPGYQLEVLDYLRRLTRDGAAVLIVLHDLPLAARYCDELLVLADGRGVAQGPPAAVLDDALLAAVFGVRGIRTTLDGVSALVGIDSAATASPVTAPASKVMPHSTNPAPGRGG
ncbi:MAG TPA: ABC transporter ATP-binding protein [Gammaproteobacteria bacterium]|nr:ABC transporter ATP-binding protein [Gammaproteobacteria bacterium]